MIVQDFIKGYCEGTLGKKTVCGNWSVINWGLMDTLVFTTIKTEREYNYEKSRYETNTEKKEERIAYKLNDGSILFNSNSLKYAGKYSYGNRIHHDQEDCQIWLEQSGAIPIPFTLFEETNTDVRDFSWIVKPTSETITVIDNRTWVRQGDKPNEVKRHFSGGCVFSIEKDVYLFDLDRKELQENKIFNAFVTKLPEKVNSIPAAYDLLMPDEVKKAIEKGIEVKRQGEFFFIKYSDECPIKIELTEKEKEILKYPPSRFGFGIDRENNPNRTYVFISDDVDPYDNDEKINTPEKKAFQIKALEYKKIFDKYTEGRSKPGTLGKSTTGSHNCEKYIKEREIVYVSGTIKQNRREHGDLILNGWYKVVPNTGVLSFTIRGDID